MNSKLTKTASILAFAIGAMAIFAGGQVLLGRMPDYYVINWLPLYNYTVGVITFLFTAVIIWKSSKFALPAAGATLAMHTVVMIVLQTAYGDIVAPDSIRAMTVRIVVWIIVLALMLIQLRNNKSAPVWRERNV